MNLSEKFPTDAEKVKQGVPIQVDGATFQMSYFNSSKAQLIFTTQTRQFSSTMAPEDAVVAAMNFTLVHVVILGWENLVETDDDGEEEMIPYSKEKLEELLVKYDGLGPLLMGKAMEIAHFKDEKKEETLEK